MDFFINIFYVYIQQLGYWQIIFLMAVESSFIPLPSEIIIPPAAFMASQGKLDLWLIILAGTLGSILGAIFNYLLARTLGRSIVYKIADTKLAKIFFLNSGKIARAEKFFLRYGNTSTFIGRLIPVVRHLISLPAGFAKMNFQNFIFFTALGSAIWVTFLAFLGYFLGANQEAIIKYYELILLFGFILISISMTIWYLAKKKNKKKLFRDGINFF